MVIWLPRQRHGATPCDIDLAIAFKNFELSSFDKRLRPKELELEISNALSLHEQLISILIPSYLAFNVVEYGYAILGKNSLRAMKEQQRIYSQFEFETIASKHD
ncbi:nucleotidyltransferase domain-containing protein [Pseudoalteromonas arctica]|uniref:nucleotidyltransferase domain-containing protein n=1 Tax=Pseudoalteromonas arctica TaxID=394751 RepID=UPI0020071678|nr:nucleotidyltransferase domain-containing protein [Pseudoalteromonas arctica]